MKNFPGSLIALVAVLALSASGVAFAQSDMGNLSASGATFAVGVVQSITSDSVTLKLESGDQMTILLANHTVGKQFLANGVRARIDYLVDDQGKAVAQEIQSGGGHAVKVTTAPVIQTSEVRVDVETTTPVQTYRAEPTVRVETLPAAEVEATVEPSEIRTPSLPATASSLPSLALLGLLSLVGAVALRFVR